MKSSNMQNSEQNAEQDIEQDIEQSSKQNSNINERAYPPMPKYQKPKKEHNFLKGFLKFLAILSGIVIVVVLLIFFVLKPMIDNFTSQIGSGGLFDMVDLYNEAQAPVNEADVVKEPFVRLDYNSGKVKVENSKLMVFSQTGEKVDISKFNKNLYFDPILLKDKEAAALLNSALDDAVKKLNNPTINELKINFDLKQISLKETATSGIFDLTIVAFANLIGVADQIGVLSILIPEKVYVNLSVKASIGADSKILFTDSKIKINNIADKSLVELFNIVGKAVFPNNTNTSVPLVTQAANFLTDFLKDGFNLFESALNMRIIPVNDTAEGVCFKWLTLNAKQVVIPPTGTTGSSIFIDIDMLNLIKKSTKQAIVNK